MIGAERTGMIRSALQRLALEDVEVVILRRFEDAHKAGDEAEMARVSAALAVFREAVAVVQEWRPTPYPLQQKTDASTIRDQQRRPM